MSNKKELNGSWWASKGSEIYLADKPAAKRGDGIGQYMVTHLAMDGFFSVLWQRSIPSIGHDLIPSIIGVQVVENNKSITRKLVVK